MADIAVMSPARQQSGAGEAIEFRQVGTAGGIAGTVILNAVLNILTLTLWRFWGRARIRRYLWGTTEINGEALEYTGTGWETFRAFLMVVLLFVLPISLGVVAGQLFLPPEVFFVIIALAYIPAILFFNWLVGVAIWLARRYQLSRTRWRGIRFGQQGSANGFAWALIGYALLTAITLGWYAPAAEMRLFRRLWRETSFGDRKFAIAHGDDGLAAPLYGPFALAWFGVIIAYLALLAWVLVASSVIAGVTLSLGATTTSDVLTQVIAMTSGVFVFVIVLGLCLMPYQVALMRRQAEVVGLEGLRFKLDARFGGLLWLFVGNFLIVVLTLGFGLPYAELRTARYVFNRLEAEGRIDLAAIGQNPVKGPKSGEGLANYLDIDADVGI